MADPDDAGKGETIASGATLLSGDTLDASAPHPPRAIRGTQIDYSRLVEVDPQHYEIGDELARGGMGRILSARDRRLGRRVAIKELIRRDGDAEARFEREARITARLQHPSIVHLHEAGRWPSGEPFYAMKLVAGTPLDRKIHATMNLDERLALLPSVIAVVDALAYAHSEGVIHRDLKPGNVLCGEFGETVVIDWGLAKDLHANTVDDMPIGPYRKPADAKRPRTQGGSSNDGTIDGAVIGTPAYMPPEQADGERVDARADVYALGAMLYHVLAGVPPYEGKTTADILTKVLAEAPPPLLERDPEIPIDLVAIVDKAMARDREERFPTAREMADELKRFQTGQLVTSHRYTAWELVRRWIDRHRAAVAVGAIAIATLAIAGVVGISEIVAQRDRADDQAAIAQARADTGTLVQASALLASDPHAALEALHQLGPDADWNAARMIAADAESRGLGRPIATYYGAVTRLAISPDGSQLAAAFDTRWLVTWNIASRAQRTIAMHGAEVMSLAFTADGALIAIDDDGAITRRERGASTDALVRRVGFEPTYAAVAPGGRQVAVFRHAPFEPDRARLVSLDGGERDIGAYFSGVWSSDGRLALYDRHDGRLVRFDPATGALGEPADAIAMTSFATDGDHIYVGTFDGDVTEPGADGDAKLATDHRGPVRHLVALPKRGVLTTSSRAILHTLDVARGKPARGDEGLYAGDFALTISAPTPAWVVKLRGHASTIGAVAASPDGSIVASGDHDGVIRLWRLPRIARTPRERPIRVTPRGSVRQGKTSTAAFLAPDRRELVLARRGPALEIRELATGRVRRVEITDYNDGIEVSTAAESMVLEQIGDVRVEELTSGSAYAITALVRSTDGRRVATLDDKKRASVFDLAAGRGRVLAANVAQIAISRDGSRVATASEREVVVWDAATGRGTPVPVEIEASALAFSPDGATLAASAPTGAILLVTGTTTRVLPGPSDQLHVLAFSPDGTRLAGGGEAWRVRIWDLATSTSSELTGHAGTVTHLVWGVGGKLFSASADGTVRIWDARGNNSLVLRGHTGLINTLDVRGDGRMLVTASADRTARIWDLATTHGRALPVHEDAVVFAGYTDDAHVVTVDHGGTITEFPDDLPADRLGLIAWLAVAIR